MDEPGLAQPSLFPGESLSSETNGVNRDSTIKATLGPFDIFMQNQPRPFTENTRKAFISDIRLLGKYFGPGQSVGDIGENDLNDFLKWLLYERGVPCGKKSYARRVTTLKVYFKWLTDKNIFLSNPAAAVIQVSVSNPLPDLPSADDIENVLTVSTELMESSEDRKGDSRPHLLLTLLLNTGIKKSETMSIVLNHINRSDPDNPFLFIRYKQPRYRYKERKMPLEHEWLAILDIYADQYQPDDLLFTCTARNLEYILTDLGEKVDLPQGTLSFENLRWIYALHEYQGGADHDKLFYRLGIKPVTWRETKSKLDRLIAKGAQEKL